MTDSSESAVVRAWMHPRDGEGVAALLKRCLLPLQERRARAYAGMARALRGFSGRRQVEDLPPEELDPLGGGPSAYQGAYQVVVANVTEDLKLASEGVLELGCVLRDFEPKDSGCGEADIAQSVAWLDALQLLEEKKLVSTVSLHALHRSGADNNSDGGVDGRVESARESISRFAKKLNAVDSDINDLLDEVRQFIADHSADDEEAHDGV